jgi:hypothetical protein
MPVLTPPTFDSLLLKEKSIQVADLDGLATILDGASNLRLWCREPDPAISAEVAELASDTFPNVRCLTSAATYGDDITGLFTHCGLNAGDFPHWVDDMGRLTTLFCRLVGPLPVTLRLETLSGDGCRRFHVDRSYLRLLCTYHGPATEWLGDEQVDWNALEQGLANEAILRQGSPNSWETFWVGVMKGAQFPKNRGKGLVHRSPPLAGSGQSRLLFCLDA